jgi:hypothetical protein
MLVAPLVWPAGLRSFWEFAINEISRWYIG